MSKIINHNDLKKIRDEIISASGNISDKKLKGGAKIMESKSTFIPSILVGLSILVGFSMLMSYDANKISRASEIRAIERLAVLEEKVGLLEDHDIANQKFKDDAYNKLIGGN